MPLYRKYLDRTEKLLTGLNIKGQTYSRPGAGALLTSGQTQFTIIHLNVGDVVTNLLTYCTVVGAGQTAVKLGLYTTAGTRLALTADVKTAFEATGVVETPLTAAYTSPSDQDVFVAILGVGGTQPTIWRTTSGVAASDAVTGGVALAGLEASQTDLDTSATIVGTTALFWHGFN